MRKNKQAKFLMPAMLGDKTFKIQGTFKSVINFPLKILTEVILSTV